MADLIFDLVIIGYLIGTIYLANLRHSQGYDMSSPEIWAVRWLLYGAIAVMGLIGLSLVGTAADVSQRIVEGEELHPVSTGSVVMGLAVLSVAMSTSATLLHSSELRMRLRAYVPGHRHYNPQSVVHMTAIVFSLLVFSGNLVSFWMQGGTPALEEQIAEEIPLGLSLFNYGSIMMAAFLGVGFATRRDVSTALRRLGLRVPEQDDLQWGAGFGCSAFAFLIVITIIVVGIIGEVDNEAANNQVEAMISAPLWSLVILIVLIPVGEEIFFRGALQPVFGNIPATIFFVSLHPQSVFTPFVIVLVAVSLGLGWLRDHHSTTAAIIAHFCYNLIQIMLALLISTT